MAVRPSYELAVGTHTIKTITGVMSLVTIKGVDTDCSISCYDVADAGDIAAGNKIISFGLDISVGGVVGGVNIIPEVRFTNGLVVVVAGANAVGYVMYK